MPDLEGFAGILANANAIQARRRRSALYYAYHFPEQAS
jgi:hypothetical protein